MAKRVEEGIDVLVGHPRLVQTGLDLVESPTIAWYETDDSVYAMRQASRRSWRIGQAEPVRSDSCRASPSASMGRALGELSPEDLTKPEHT